jgi:hypothetical protein
MHRTCKTSPTPRWSHKTFATGQKHGGCKRGMGIFPMEPEKRLLSGKNNVMIYPWPSWIYDFVFFCKPEQLPVLQNASKMAERR